MNNYKYKKRFIFLTGYVFSKWNQDRKLPWGHIQIHENLTEMIILIYFNLPVAGVYQHTPAEAFWLFFGLYFSSARLVPGINLKIFA